MARIMTVEANFFGTPEFKKNGQPLTINRRKMIGLLAYLIGTGSTHSRDALATLFWPENDQSTARANLRRELSRLRREFGEFFSIDRLQVAIDSEQVETDIGRFQALLAQADEQTHDQSPLDATIYQYYL